MQAIFGERRRGAGLRSDRGKARTM